MSDNRRRTEISEDGVFVGNQAVPLDAALLSRAILELNITRKNITIYPEGHIQIAQSVDRANEHLSSVIASWPNLLLGVTRDSLLLGNGPLDPKNPVLNEFSSVLHGHGIASISFHDGLTRTETERFLRILSSSPEEMREAGGVAKAICDANIHHIQIQPIDYRCFQLTEENEISRPDSKEQCQSETQIWNEFINDLISGCHARGDITPPLRRMDTLDPSELAEFLNDHQFDSEIAVQSFHKTLAKHPRRILAPQDNVKLNDLMKQLHPELRQQFLSATFDLASNGHEQILEGFSDDVVLEILQKANAEKKTVSPTLVALLGKLSNTGVGSTPANGTMPPSDAQLDIEATEKLMLGVLEPENPEAHMAADHASLLQRLAGSNPLEYESCPNSTWNPNHTPRSDGLDGGREGCFQVDGYAATFEEKHLDSQINRMIIALLDNDMEPDDYEGFGRHLVSNTPELLELGEFDLVLALLQTLHRHEEQKPEPIRQRVVQFLETLVTPDFIARAVEAFRNCPGDKVETASSLIALLGPSCIPRLMTLYAEDKVVSGKKALFNLLVTFEEEALQEAYKKIHDPRVHVLRNLLIFMQAVGNQASLPYIRPLSHHSDHLVRMEAVLALLKLGEPNASTFLRHALRSNVAAESINAIVLAGWYRVNDVVDELTRMIKHTPFRKLDYKKNQEIVKSLGRIGNARALPFLARLARKRLTIHPRRLKELKLILFESLAGYRKADRARLLDIGSRSSDYRIRKACARLFRADECST